jgi:hypothetical protein
VREKESSKRRKEEAKEQLGSSTCMLKSPTMKISEGEVARSSSRKDRSERKLLLGEEGDR